MINIIKFWKQTCANLSVKKYFSKMRFCGLYVFLNVKAHIQKYERNMF